MEFKMQGELTFQDYLKAALYTGRKFIALEVLVGIAVVLLLILPSDYSVAMKWFYAILFPVVGGLLVLLLIYVKEKKAYSSVDKRFHDRIIEIDEKGVLYGSADSSAALKWSDIKGATFRKEFLLLSVSTTQALLIPKRFFHSPEEEKACIAFIKGHI